MSHKPLLYKNIPNDINEMILPDITKSRLLQKISTKNVGNIIITGNNGVGKTLSINIVTKKIYGDKLNECCLFLNTGSNRGLQDLKNVIEDFCTREVDFISRNGLHKLIFFDDADNITKKAKNMIGNIMDINENVNFVFVCNNLDNISLKIKSKCEFLLMENIKTDSIQKKLTDICINESVKYSKEGIKLIAKNSKGDIRKSINALDSIINCYSYVNTNCVEELSFQPKSKELNQLINSCINGDLKKSLEILNDTKNKGYCYFDILVTMIDVIKNSNLIQEIKIRFINIISKCLYIISSGLESEIQVYNCIVELITNK